MDTVMKVKDILESNGIFVSEEDYDEELVIESIQFVSIIVAIENAFNISVPDDYFSGDRLKTFNDYIRFVRSVS